MCKTTSCTMQMLLNKKQLCCKEVAGPTRDTAKFHCMRLKKLHRGPKAFTHFFYLFSKHFVGKYKVKKIFIFT